MYGHLVSQNAGPILWSLSCTVAFSAVLTQHTEELPQLKSRKTGGEWTRKVYTEKGRNSW